MATLADAKRYLQVGMQFDVTNHYITALRSDHPCAGTRRCTVTTVNGSAFVLYPPHSRVAWPKATQVTLDPATGVLQLFGGGAGQRPDEPFLTLTPVASPEDTMADQVNAVLQAASEWAGAELVATATNFFGVLSLEPATRLMALISNPSCDTWDDAHSIIINGSVGLGRTLWQAVLAVDETCPDRGAPEGLGERLTPAARWGGYAPDTLTVLTAIAAAVQEKGRW